MQMWYYCIQKPIKNPPTIPHCPMSKLWFFQKDWGLVDWYSDHNFQPIDRT